MLAQRVAVLLGGAPPAPRRLSAAAAARRGARRAVTVAQSTAGVPVTFRVHKKVGPGEHVRVVGQPHVLGEWDIGRAPKLELIAPDHDLWAGTVNGLVTGSPFPFKFVVLPDGTASAQDVVWEAIPDRTFQPGGEQTITASWDREGFEAGPVAPGTGGPQGSSHTDASAQIKARLDATIARLVAEGRAKQ